MRGECIRDAAALKVAAPLGSVVATIPRNSFDGVAPVSARFRTDRVGARRAPAKHEHGLRRCVCRGRRPGRQPVSQSVPGIGL